MKKLLLCAAFIAASFTSIAQVGFGTTTPDASAALEIESTTKGFLPPRMDTTARNAIVSAKAGLVIYNTSANALQWFDGTEWYDTRTNTSENPFPTNSNLTVENPTYQGKSVIDSEYGIGYNGEAVLAGSTITVELTNPETSAQNYGLSATDAVSGLIYSATGTIAASTMISVILTPNAVVMPEIQSGVLTMALTGTGSSINLVPRIDIKSIPASATEIIEVQYGAQTWMDRNLGARQAATAIDDAFSYGNSYQWGRPADGHEIIVRHGTSVALGRGLAETTTVLSNTNTPMHADFILNSWQGDWLSAPDTGSLTLWGADSQGPCPAGYRVPTNNEWQELRVCPDCDDDGIIYDLVDGFNRVVKLSSCGRRSNLTGTIEAEVELWCDWWSSDQNNVRGPGPQSRYRRLAESQGNSGGDGDNTGRAEGKAVRCIKN